MKVILMLALLGLCTSCNKKDPGDEDVSARDLDRTAHLGQVSNSATR